MPGKPESLATQAVTRRVAWLGRQLLRDWRGGETRLLALTVMVTVATMTSVAFFTERVRLGLLQQGAQLLAADLVVRSADAIAPALATEAARLGLDTARALVFRSMLSTADELQLAEVKAVSPAYPLRGRLRAAAGTTVADAEVPTGPDRGEVWPDLRLAQLLRLEPGAEVQLGDSRLRVGRILTWEPDRGADAFNIAPRLLMHVDDVAATGLIVPGSRVGHRLLVAGEAEAVAAFRTRLRRGDTQALRVREVGSSESRQWAALRRAEQFLGLGALAAVALAGVALALSARLYVERHLDTVALMRALGASRALVSLMHVVRILLLGLLASVPGCLLGYLAQELLGRLLDSFTPQQLPPPPLDAWLQGPLVALATLFGFCLPQLLRLYRVPPLRVLRRDLGGAGPGPGLVAGLVVLTLLLLAPWQSGQQELSAWLAGGLLLSVAVMVVVTALCLRLLRGLRRYPGLAWCHGLANLGRRPAAGILQITGIATGIGVLLVLALVRAQLDTGWRERTGPLPNYFLVNVLPEQVDALATLLGEASGRDIELHPMVRARLVAINDRPLRLQDYADDRARRLAAREFNLSWLHDLPPDNRIVAGRWWRNDGAREFSVETDIAETLGIALGDRLRYNIAGREVEATVSSLRTVRWDSFRVNFFVAANPGWLDAYPATWITSFYLPRARQPQLRELVRTFPNVTVLDVDALVSRTRAIVAEATHALELVFGFVLLAGLLVMAAALQTTALERRREGALLRALGAARSWVLGSHLAEFIGMGLLAGALSAGTATLTAWLLTEQVLRLAFQPGAWLLPAALLAGGTLVPLFGLLGTHAARHRPPVIVLRQAH